MLKKVLSEYQKLQDVFFVKQLYFFSEWLKSEVVPERRVYQIETSWISKKVSLDDVNINNEPFFLFCEKNSNGEFLEKIKILTKEDAHTCWRKIFNHQNYEIYEKFETSSSVVKPLRFGLSCEEQEIVLAIARKSLVGFVRREAISSVFSISKFNEVCDVGVIIWIKGRLRGSQIVTGMPLHKGVIEATKRSCVDGRFQSVNEDELVYTRIEVTLLHSLKMPLMYKEVKMDTLHYNKVYSASLGGKEGVYVPAVFNCVRFQSLQHLAGFLFIEKMSINFSSHDFKHITLSESSGYIETDNLRSSLPLDGPIPQVMISNDSLHDRLEVLSSRALAYLERNQEISGMIPMVIQPATRGQRVDDLARFIFTTYSLFLYHTKTKNPQSRRIAEKSFNYIRKNIYVHTFLSNGHKAGAFVYYAMSAKLFQDEEEYEKSREVLKVLVDVSPYDPILYSQYALLLLDGDDVSIKNSVSYIEKLFLDFKTKQKRKEEIDLASYSELPKLLLALGAIFPEKDFYCIESKRIIEWYMARQNSDGSFYSSTTRSFSYTRGTAKILEVLSGIENIPQQKLENAFRYCVNMQYNKENSYFIPKELQDICEGGLRHDYYNQEIWIDGIGHILIAFANLKTKN